LVLNDKTLDGASFIVYLTLAFNILTPAKAISKASYSVKMDWPLQTCFEV
jgi:subfamily B ATP-binding cassette protein MsbA